MQMHSRLTQSQYVGLLALAAALILVVGSWLKPEARPEVTITQSERLQLQNLTQRRNLEDMGVFFAQIADDVRSSIVWLQPTGASGLVWNASGRIVTAGSAGEFRAFPGLWPTSTSSGIVEAQPVVVAPDPEVVMLEAATPPADGQMLEPVRFGFPERLGLGVWVLLVSRQGDGQHLFTPGIYSGVATIRCGGVEYRALQSSIPLTGAGLGGTFFDLDGGALGMVVRCDDSFAALTLESLEKALEQADTPASQLATLLGLEAAALDDVTKAFFSASEGALVTTVVDGMPAADAGLRPGDVITSVSEIEVSGVEDLLALLDPGNAESELSVTRNQREIRIPWPDLLAPPAPLEGSGIGVESEPSGYLVGTVVPGSAAQRASIQPGDRILSVNGRVITSEAALQAALARAGGQVYIVFQHGRERFGTFVR